MEKRSELIELIKKVSELSGGDDPQWLKEYTEEVLKLWAHNLDKAIECFTDLNKPYY